VGVQANHPNPKQGISLNWWLEPLQPRGAHPTNLHKAMQASQASRGLGWGGFRSAAPVAVQWGQFTALTPNNLASGLGFTLVG